MSRGRHYTPKQRQAAVDAYTRDGLANAHRTTGIPRSTIATWAAAAGATSPDPEQSNEKTAKARAVLSAQRRARVEEVLDVAQVKLASMANDAMDATVAVLHGGVAPGQSGVHPAIKMASPSQLVGIWTRALHDLNLLRGDPTEITPSGEVHVTFTTPMPTTKGRHLHVVDVDDTDDGTVRAL